MDKNNNSHYEGEDTFPPNTMASNKWNEISASQEDELKFINRSKFATIDSYDDVEETDLQPQEKTIVPIRVSKHAKRSSIFDNAWLYDSESSQANTPQEINSFQTNRAMDGMSRVMERKKPIYKIISTSSFLEEKGKENES